MKHRWKSPPPAARRWHLTALGLALWTLGACNASKPPAGAPAAATSAGQATPAGKANSAAANSGPTTTSGSAAGAPAAAAGSVGAAPVEVVPLKPLTPELEAALKAWQPSPPISACADCHPEHVEGFLSTGMGRALYRPNDQPKIEDFAPEKATVKHPATGVLYQASVDAEGRWWQEERLADGSYQRRVEVKYIVGSGNHTRSYIGEVEGDLVQLPLTWYSGRGIWDMSPGYANKLHMRFERPIKAQCVFCHNDLSPVTDLSLASFGEPFATGITCNRCHGNGTEHIQVRLAGKGVPKGQVDPTILNPKNLSNDGQLQICQQCHLPGQTRTLLKGRRWDAYDPRVPLDQYMSIYLTAKNGGPEFGIASHGHRTAMSRCFTESKGALTCTTCHDPHKADKKKAAEDACLGCHKAQDCGDEHVKARPAGAHGADDKTCASCHMYRGGTSDIPHVQFTDHFIRKNPRGADEHLEVKPTIELVDALVPPGRVNGDPLDAAVRLGMAHHDLWRFEGKAEHAPEAIKRLTEALAQSPDRPEAWQDLARLHASQRNAPEALNAFAQLEKYDPQGVPWRLDYALLLENTQQLVPAEQQLLRVVQLAPKSRLAWGNLGNVLQKQGRFAEAEQAYDQADRVGPTAASTANNRGYNALAQGKLDEAEVAFKESIRRDGLGGRGHFNLAQLAMQREDQVTALKHLDAAIDRDPDYTQARFVRGRVRITSGDLEGARADFSVVVVQDPQKPFGYLGLAEAFNALGRSVEVVRVLNEGVLATNGHPAIVQVLQRVQANPSGLRPDLPLMPAQ